MITAAEIAITAYSSHGVLRLPRRLPRAPVPRSTRATVAATPAPSAPSQTAAHAPSRMRSVRSNSPGSRPVAQPRALRGVRVVGHQQLVCAALLVFDESTVPSLVVIEQLSLLTRNRLDACTEPTSDFEMGVTVSDHGM